MLGFRARLSIDIYTATGVAVLLISSIALAFVVISNWGLIVVDSDRSNYLLIILIASATPLAMLLLYLFNIRGNRIRLGSEKTEKIDIDSIKDNINIINIEEQSETKQPTEKIDKEIKVETVPISDQKKEPIEQTQAVEEPKTQAASNTKIDIEGVIREEVTKATTDLISKIDGFSQEIISVKKELEEMKSAVENAMIDIRSLLSEISNPLNYMRRFVTDEEIEELGLNPDQGAGVNGGDRKKQSTQYIEVKKNPIKEPGKIVEHNSNGQNMDEVSIESIDIDNFSKELAEIFSKRMSVSKLMRMIIFIGDNLSILGRDGLLGIVELGVSSGVIPKESMDIVAKVVSLIERTKIPPKRLALTLHKLAKSVGVSDREAEFLAMALSEG
ncbi:MAG: hypothetical protein QXI22_01430 [Sulfolobales archaeon]